jgi:hypothetical protein
MKHPNPLTTETSAQCHKNITKISITWNIELNDVPARERQLYIKRPRHCFALSHWVTPNPSPPSTSVGRVLKQSVTQREERLRER